MKGFSRGKRRTNTKTFRVALFGNRLIDQPAVFGVLYVMRDARIAEVRAYFMYDESGNAELTGFPYDERGYLVL